MSAPPGKLGSYRLACWIWPGRIEGVLFAFVGWAYRRDEARGKATLVGWAGERADDLQARLCRARAWWRWRMDGRP